MDATRESWKNEALGAATPIPFEARYTAAEFALIRKGFVPEVMEDKWFIYYDAGSLFFHRSWTGKAVFRVDFREDHGFAYVVQAVCATALVIEEGADYHARVVDFLIGNRLLGRKKPFPRHADAYSLPTGLLQHSVSGTGYPEVVLAKRQPWWKFWR